VQRYQKAAYYYHYDSPRRARANTNDRLEDRRKRSANFFLYQDETGEISFVTILSENKVESRLKFQIAIDSPMNTTIQLRDGPTDRSVRWNSFTKVATADFSWKGTTKGIVLGPITNYNSIERACVTVTITDHPINVDYLVVHGHIQPSAATTNPSALTLYEYDALINTTLRFCYTRCSCNQSETITALQGEIDPLSVEFGTSYSFTSGSGIVGERYSDKSRCTWVFAVPNVAGIGIQFSKWDVSAADAITLYKGDTNTAASRLIDGYSRPENPGPRNFTGGRAGFVFAPNNDGSAKSGFVWPPSS
jgi:hypothetical protein